MAEQISLQVPATLSALTTVRMVLGGLGARLDLSLDELDDLYLATDRLLQAALDVEQLDLLEVDMTVADGALRVTAGSFRTEALRAQVAVTPGGCIDLCTLLQRLVDDVVLQDADDGFTVLMVKRGAGGTT
jgi:hypothetical protein